MHKDSNNLLSLINALQSESVTQAEQSLAELAVQDPQFLAKLLAIIKSDQPYNTKVSAMTFLNSAICDNLFQIQEERYLGVLEDILVDPQIQATFKRLLQRSIVAILDGLDQPELTQFRQLVFKLAKDEQLRDTAYLIIGCFCVPDDIDLQHIIYLTRVYMLDSLNKIVMPNSPDKMYLLREYNQILKTWISAWDKLYAQEKIEQKEIKEEKGKKVEKMESQTHIEQTKLLLQICQAQQFSHTIIEVYKWLSQPPIFICTHPEYCQLNILKQQASELHYRALALSHRKQTHTHIYEATKGIIMDVVNNLVLVAGNRGMLEEFKCRDFVINLVRVVRGFLICQPGFLREDWKAVLATVVFPLIKPEEEELYSFEETPAEFSTYFEDCTQKQIYGSLKSQTCKLLQKISDKSQQITQSEFLTDFIINFCVDSIKNALGHGPINVYGIDYVALDVAITSMCIFSFRMGSHREKLAELKQMLSKELALTLKPYERTMFYLFLGYNYDDIYVNTMEGSFWIEIALEDKSHPTAEYCANDFLYNIADEYYSDFFVQQLSNKIITTTNANTIDALAKMIKCQAQKISPGLMLEVLEKVYGRLYSEMTKLQGMEIKETLIAIKLIHVVGNLAQQNQYCKQYPNVREAVWKLMLAFNDAAKMDFETEIYPIVEALLGHEDHISATSAEVLGLILSEFARDEYYEIHFYRILNQFIMKSTSCSKAIGPPILHSLKTAIIYNILNMGETLKKAQRRQVHSNLLILLQNFLVMHGKTLLPEQVLEISSILMRYLPNIDDEEKIDCPVVLARALNNMFICHLLYPANTILEYVLNYGSREVYFNYDIRVLLTCIKAELQREEATASLSARLLVLAANVISAFRKREKQDAHLKKLKAKYGKENRLKLTKYKEYEKILKQLNTPFKQEAKLEKFFTQIIEEVREQNTDKFAKVAAEIPSDWIEKICEICKFPEGTLIKKRAVYSVLRKKAPEDIDREQQDHEMKNSEEEEQQDYKRKRLQVKKKKKLKEQATKIDQQQ